MLIKEFKIAVMVITAINTHQKATILLSIIQV